MVATPLTQLTKRGRSDKVSFDQSCHGAFSQLKEILMTQPVLKVTDPEQPFILQTDTYEYGLGAVLSQENENGQEHPVAYASQKLFSREINYSVIEKESWAIVWALAYVNVYLEGRCHSADRSSEDNECQLAPHAMGLGSAN